jgi:hypothetical protein
MTMRLYTQSYNNGGSAYNAAAEETAITDYRIDHAFNRPAECWVTLKDDTGTIAAKYNDDANDVYIGAGKMTLESSIGTYIFKGRIISATADTERRTVVLYCQDWLSQLDDEQITYDMREDLDGSGLRMSFIYPDYDDTDGEGIGPANHNGASYYVYDHEMSWANDAFNGMNMIFDNRMAGDITVTTGPYGESSDASSIDVWTHDIGDAWTMDSDAHTTADVGGPFTDEYYFKVWVPDSDFHVSTDTVGASVTIYFQGSTSSATVDIYDNNAAGWVEIGEGFTANASSTYEVKTFTIPEEIVADTLDASGVVKVRMNEQNVGGGGFVLRFIAVKYGFATTGYSLPIVISDTANGNRLTVNTQLDADATRVWHGLPYSIARTIAEHIDSAETPGDIITGGDSMETLTCAATIEATSGVSTRLFENMTRLQILYDLSRQDKAEFYAELGTTTVTYKSTWGANSNTLTDTSLLSLKMIQDWSLVCNEVNQYGMRYGDQQLFTNDTDATSIAKYNATRSRTFKDQGLVSEYDTKSRASTYVDQYSDVRKYLTARLPGLDSSYRLGTITEVTSAYMGITAADYIVDGWSYDSSTHETEIHLHPKVTQIGLVRDPTTTSVEQALSNIRKGPIDKYIPSPDKDTVVNP